MEYQHLEINYQRLGMKIREQRKLKKYTQEKTADLVGITLNYFQRIESSNAKLSLVALVRISQVLECSIDYLLSDTIKLPDDKLLNLSTLNEIEREFIIKTIKNLKEVELQVINQLK